MTIWAEAARGSLAANSKEIHYGADDNASGVAAMLELAQPIFYGAEKQTHADFHRVRAARKKDF
jgi:hypothetical protein